MDRALAGDALEALQYGMLTRYILDRASPRPQMVVLPGTDSTWCLGKGVHHRNPS